MVSGSCLCGKIRFEVSKVIGPFELCHCSRCRKVTGSAFMAGVYVERNSLRFTKGKNQIKSYEAPIIHEPPAYRGCFCPNCGSPVPDPQGDSNLVEIPAGLLGNGVEIKPDKHIYTGVHPLDGSKSMYYKLDRKGAQSVEKKALFRRRDYQQTPSGRRSASRWKNDC